MKDSLKKFYEYLGSDENLMDFVRLHAEWSEDSFLQMKRLARDVIRDYAAEDSYPKRFVAYFMVEIPTLIDILSHFKHCSEKERLAGYTDKSYRSMIAERSKQLEEFRQEFIRSLENY